MCVKTVYVWYPSTSTCEIDKYLKSIISDSNVICDENLDVTKATLRLL